MNFQENLIFKLRKYTGQVAISSGAERISYEELLNSTRAISRLILKQGLEQNNYVGVYVDDRIDIIRSMIGVMLAGGVFVPLDPSHPKTRTSTIIADTGMKYVVSSSQISAQLSVPDHVKVLLIEKTTTESEEESVDVSKYNLEDSAYVYFTSGSTGKPKGIVGSNKALLQFIEWQTSTFDFNTEDRFAQFTTPYFDAFLRDIFTPLFAGATICICPKEEAFLSSDNLRSWIDEQRISVIHCVPSLFYTFNQADLNTNNFNSLRYIFMSGEKIAPAQLKKWYDVFATRVQLVNFYGASESTMIRSYYHIKPSDANQVRVPVGKPIADTQLVILDDQQKQREILAPGELYIVSEFITKGYLNNDELTAEKFVEIELEGKRYKAYRTGDEARMLADGNIDLLGRKDRQVKINGIRIELEEIDNVILQFDQIEKALTAVHKDQNGNQTIRSFIVKSASATSAEIVKGVQAFLSENLPGYMVPAGIVEVQEFPLLSNGKIDTKGLLAKVILEEKEIDSLSSSQKEVAGVWKKILGDKPIAVDKSFFLSGGNSLSFMNLIAALNKKYGIKLSLSQLFQSLTVEKQAALIEKMVGKNDSHHESAITPTIKEHYVVTSAQKRLYFLHKFDTNSVAYNMPQFVIIEGQLTLDRLKNAFNKLVERHALFRTNFIDQDGEIVQRISPSQRFDVNTIEAGERELDDLIKEFVQPFDLLNDVLLRVSVAKLGKAKSLLMIDMHHIISDGVSFSLLINDFIELYNNKELPPLTLQYKDYAEWQQSEQQQGQIKKQKEFWVNNFRDAVSPLQLPTDFKRPQVIEDSGASVSFLLDEQDTLALKAVANKVDATLFMTLLSIFNIFLSKITGQRDIVIGTPVDGRRHADLKNMIGMFVNTLPLRNEINDDQKFIDFLSAVKNKALQCFENQSYPFEALVDELNLERDTSRNPLFDVMFNYQNFEISGLSIPALKLTPYDKNRISKFDFTLYGSESKEGTLHLNFNYSTALFKRETVAQFVHYFLQIVRNIYSEPEKCIGELSLLSKEEVHARSVSFTKPLDTPIVPIQNYLRESFKNHSERTALEYEGKSYSYETLGKESDCIVSFICDQNLERETPLGILCEDKKQLITSILGILKSRMIFVPLDMQLPKSRLMSMLKQLGCRHIITDLEEAKYSQFVDPLELKIWDVRNLNYSEKRSDLKYDGEDNIYAYFTSGTTGDPKGIIGKNKGLAQFIDWEIKTFNIDSSVRFSQFTNPGFDAILRDIFVPLCAGAVICIPDKTSFTTGAAIANWIEENKIHLIHCVPSLFKLFSRERLSSTTFKALKYILLAGEKIAPAELTKWYDTFEKRICLVNLYGATETTLVKGYYLIQPEDVHRKYIPISPMNGAQFIILNDQGQLCPPLVTGEVYIRTPFRSAGYVGDVNMNSQRFINNPFNDQVHDLLYKTGDIARETLAGEIEIIGRADFQVKVNGVRIELADIKENILKYPQIEWAEAAMKDDTQGRSLLCGYYQSSSDIDKVALRTFLSSLLPGYMLPGFLCQVDRIPLTINGKLDLKSLPNPIDSITPEFDVASTAREKVLTGVWCTVLGRESIGIKDNFFSVGGDSLKSIRVISHLKKEGYDISVKDLFIYQTIELLAPQMKEIAATYAVEEKIVPAKKREYYPLSSAQKRQFISHQMRDNTLNFNMKFSIEVGPSVTKEQVTETLNHLIKRHDVLRTSFRSIGGEPVQMVHESMKVDVQEIALDQFNTEGFRFSMPFDLDKPPLIRVGFIQGKSNNLVLIDIHHIISDGISNILIKEEFLRLLNGEELPSQGLQYKDFAVWQNEHNSGENMKQMASYWLSIFKKEISRLEWPKNLEATYEKLDNANSIAFRIDQQSTRTLKALAVESGVSLFALLLSLQAIVLHKLTSLEDLVVGFPSAGRNRLELDKVIGVFINTIALRLYPRKELMFRKFLKEVGDHVNQALHYQDYPFDDLIEQLNLPRVNNFNPLFNTVMAMQNHIDYSEMDIASDKEGDIVRETFEEIAENELFIRCADVKDQLIINYQYSKGVLLRQDVVDMFEYFKEIIKAVTENSNIKIRDIRLSHSLTEANGQLLEDAFNF